MKKDSLQALALCSIIVALVTFSTEAKAGATNGIALCENVIIPALMPILILTNIIIKSRCAIVFDKLFGVITKNILKLPQQTTSAIIFGLVGGYPAGAILTEHLYNNSIIDKQDAKRIMSFNFCGGVAFIITAIGSHHLGSTKLGCVLFTSCIAAAMITATIGALFTKQRSSPTYHRIKYLSLEDAMIESVEATTHSIINICAYIILFSAITNILPIPKQLYPLIEITNGVITDQYTLPLPECAFFLSIGGLCIHFQLIGILKNMGIKYHEFLLYRLANGVISYAIVKAYLYIFPQSEDVFSTITQKSTAFADASPQLSIILLIGCVVIIFDIENKKYKLI